MTVFLVGATYAHYLSIYVEKDHGRAALQPTSTPRQGRGLTRAGSPSSVPVPAPPPMRVVTKGWWVLREEEASVEDLEKADRENQLAWAAGMALLAEQYAADLSNLPSNERREASLWANALSTCAHELVDGEAGSRPRPGTWTGSWGGQALNRDERRPFRPHLFGNRIRNGSTGVDGRPSQGVNAADMTGQDFALDGKPVGQDDAGGKRAHPRGNGADHREPGIGGEGCRRHNQGRPFASACVGLKPVQIKSPASGDQASGFSPQ